MTPGVRSFSPARRLLRWRRLRPLRLSGMTTWLALAAVLVHGVCVHAQDTSPVLRLLQSIESAARTQDYAGVFARQQGQSLVSSRIVHMVDGTGERERLERLDGEPREYLRHNEAARCLMPARKLVIRARTRSDRFPALLLGDGQTVDQHYRLRDAPQTMARVAGRECRLFHLEPRDAQRYGYTLCTDTQTGLLLKMQIVNRNGVMEQTAFSSVATGKDVSPAQLEPDWDTRDWDVRDDHTASIHLGEQGWRIPAPDGYQIVTQVLRPMAKNRQVNQLVLSDGLAAISVFIEPMQSLQPRDKMMGTTLHRGALSIHMARIGDYGLTVVGDAPPAVLQELAQRTQFVPPPANP